MNFLSHQNHDSLATDFATPLLKLLSTAENLEIFEELDHEIKELLSNLDPFSFENSIEKNTEKSSEIPLEKPYIRSNAIESLELLSNFSLIDEAFELIVKNNAIETIISLLSFEISQEERILLQNGELSNNERLITANLKFLNFSLIKHRISLGNCEKIKENLIFVIRSEKFSPIQLCEAIKALRNLLKYKENEDFLIKSCLKEGLLDFLIEKLEKNRENPEILQEINGFFLEMTRISSEIAGFLSEKDFLRILLKETRGFFREFLKEESLEKLEKFKENMNFLMIFSMLGEKPAKKLFEGSCADLCLNVVLKGFEKKSKENFTKENSKKTAIFEENEEKFDFEKNRENSENDDFFTNLSKVFPETLRILLNLAEFNDILDKKHKEFVVLLQIISGFFYEREICIFSAELFIKIMTKELKIELLPIFFRIFSKILIFFPLDEKLDFLLCSLFFEINPLIYLENLKNFDENSFEKSLFPLANSLLIYKDPKNRVFLSEFEISRSNEVLRIFKDKLPENMNNLMISLMLLSRLCCFSCVKSSILKSPIPKLIFLIISSHFSQNSSQNSFKNSSKLLEISLAVLIEILDFPLKNNEKIDHLTFEYQQIQPSFTVTEALSDLFLSNSGKFINEIVFFAENSQENSSKISQKSLELLFVISYLHPAIAVFLNENCGLAKLQSLYEDICKRSRFSEEKSLVLKVCKLICAMARIQSCFLEILHKTEFLEILLENIKNFQRDSKENSMENLKEDSKENSINLKENSNENSINLKENSNEKTKELEEYLWCLGTFAENFFDKMELLEKKTMETLFVKFGDLQRNFPENAAAMVQLLKTSKILLKDPAIARFICAKNANFELFEDFLKKLHKEKSKVVPFKENIEEFKAENIESSSNLKEKTIENLLDVFVEMTRNPLIIEDSQFFTGGFIEEMMGIMIENQSNFIVIVRGLKIIENSMKVIYEKTKNAKKFETAILSDFISKNINKNSLFFSFFSIF